MGPLGPCFKQTNRQTYICKQLLTRAIVIVLHKLKMYGIDGNLHQWLTDYLSNRKQRVVLNNSFSSWSNVPAGVPQGSILGPLLFSLYINDLPKFISHSKVVLYANECTFISRNSVLSCNSRAKMSNFLATSFPDRSTLGSGSVNPNLEASLRTSENRTSLLENVLKI